MSTKSGKGWKARVYVCDQDGVRREVTAMGATKQGSLDRLTDKLEARGFVMPGKQRAMTIQQLADKWIEHKRSQSIRKSTIGQYRSCLDQVLLPEIGSVRIDQVDRAYLLQRLEDIAAGRRTGFDNRKTPRPRAGVRITGAQPKTVLTMLMGYAWDQGYLDHHPLATHSRGRAKRPDGHDPDSDEIEVSPIRVLDAEERFYLGWLLEHAERPKTRGGRQPSVPLLRIVQVILNTGLRIGEVCALRWRDVIIDPEARKFTITVTGTFVEPDGKELNGPSRNRPKSAAGHRQFSLTNDAMDVLLGHRLLSKRTAPNDFVFSSSSGNMLWTNNLRSRLRAIVADTALEGVKFHDLRKTFATVIAGRMSPEEVMLVMGHSSISVTRQYYIRPTLKTVKLRPQIERAISIDPYSPHWTPPADEWDVDDDDSPF